MSTLSNAAKCGTCGGPGREADPAAVRDALETLLRALHATPCGWQEDGDVVQAVDAAAELCGREPGRYELAKGGV